MTLAGSDTSCGSLLARNSQGGIGLASAQSPFLASRADANPIPPWEFRAKSEPQDVSDPAKVMVYIATKRPDKYHVKECRTLAKNGGLEIKLADALKQN